MGLMEYLLNQLHRVVWGPWTVAIFLTVGMGFTVKSGFFQVRGFGRWWRCTVGSIFGDGNQKGEEGISQLQSVCTALAATVGTGNIAGVATALTAGGPGALFWMWVCAGIGMATAYAETMLGMKSRIRDERGGYICGPFLYMESLLGAEWMGILYGGLCLLCALGMGSMAQANSAAGALSYSWRVPKSLAGIVLTGLVLLVILGGIRRIGWVAERLVPAASGIYILFSLLVILPCWRQVPGILASVVRCALLPEAAAGGAAGYGVGQAMRYGMARGVFSNESGLGTLAILHGAARDPSGEKQGMWAMFEVFFDTIVLCTLTALVILCATGPAGGPGEAQGAALAAWCFEVRLGTVGELFTAGAMAVFAFATMIAWFYMGRQAAAYLGRKMGLVEEGLWLRVIYPLLFLGAVLAGSQWSTAAVWAWSDLWNGFMAFPNLTALIFLRRQVKFPGRRE